MINGVENKKRVLCLGVLCLDILGRIIETIPEEQKSTFIDEIVVSAGGTAGLTSVALAKLGVPTSVFGVVGEDSAGEILKNRIKSFGADISRILVKSDEATSASILPIRKNGDRPALHVPGANFSFNADDLPKISTLDYSWFHYAGALRLPLLDGTVISNYLKELKSLGVITSCDVLGTRTLNSKDLMKEVLPNIDFFLPNIAEGRLITEYENERDVAKALLDMGCGCVILKMGDQGSLIMNAHDTFKIPALPAKVVDSTGCGDSYSAGFIFGQLAGLSLENSGLFGAAIAALVIEKLGGDTADISYKNLISRANFDKNSIKIISGYLR